MRIPAISISRWAVNGSGDVFRADGYIGIQTDSPGGLIGLRDDFTYIDVDGAGNIYFSDSSGVHTIQDLLNSGSAGGSNITELREAIQIILKDLDGYVTNTTEIQHHTQLSQAIQTIRKDLDGYASKVTESEHYNQLSNTIQTIRKDLDGYSLNSTETEHYNQLSGAIQIIRKDLDGYASKITEAEHHSQLSNAIFTIRKDLDGYVTNATELQHHFQLSQAIQTIRKDLDGYVPNITEVQHHAQLSNAIQTIRKDLDGYTTAAQGFDGYIAFFTGAKALAGDNDLYWDRVTNRLRVGTGGNLSSDTDGYVLFTNNANTSFSSLVLGTHDISGIRIEKNGTQLQIRDGAGGSALLSVSQLKSESSQDASFATNMSGGGFRGGTNSKFGWSNTTLGTLGTTDTYFTRNAAGVVGLFDTGATAGLLQFGSLTKLRSTVDGNLRLTTSADADADSLSFGILSTSLKLSNSSGSLHVRLNNDSFASLQAGRIVSGLTDDPAITVADPGNSGGGGVRLGQIGRFSWSSANRGDVGTTDTAIARYSAGTIVLLQTMGTIGNLVAGRLQLAEKTAPSMVDGYNTMWVDQNSINAVFFIDGYNGGIHTVTHQFAEYYVSVTGTNVIGAGDLNTYVKVAGVTSTGEFYGDWAIGSGNRATYTGTQTIPARLNCSIGVSEDAGTPTIGIAFFKNGVVLSKSSIDVKEVAANDRIGISIGAFTTLATNDFIEVYIRSDTAGNITIHQMNVNIVSL